MRSAPILTEADILADLVAPNRPGLSPEAARSILALKFSTGTTTRIRRLLRKNNRGTITAGERIALEKYLRVGQLLDLLQAKAKASLHRSGNAD